MANPYRDMTLEAARENPYWNLIAISRKDDPTHGPMLSVTTEVMTAEVRMPDDVVSEVATPVGAAIARMITDRIKVDLLELEAVMTLKVQDFIDSEPGAETVPVVA